MNGGLPTRSDGERALEGRIRRARSGDRVRVTTGEEQMDGTFERHGTNGISLVRDGESRATAVLDADIRDFEIVASGGE